MKTIIIYLFSTILFYTTSAQKASFIVNKEITKIILYDLDANLKINSNNNDSISFQIENRSKLPDKAEGLKPIGFQEDNSKIGLNIFTKNNTIEILKASPTIIGATINVAVPEYLEVKVISNQITANKKIIEINNMKTFVEINNKSSDIILKNIMCPISINNLNGSINIDLSTQILNKPCFVSSTIGDVNISIPEVLSTNLVLKTLGGIFYSDFELNNIDEKSPNIGKKSVTKLNKGGKEIHVETVTGNIYIRKK